MEKYKKIPDDGVFISRFQSKIRSLSVSKTGCLDWKWTKNCSRYGVTSFKRKLYLAHRVAYFLHHGTLNDTLVVDHTCSNRKCVNPEHLEQKTISENIQIEFIRFPEKKRHRCDSGRCSLTCDHAPYILKRGTCKHGHVIKSISDITASRKCRVCNTLWQRNYVRKNPDYHKRWREGKTRMLK